jgi:hypothetical protein
LYDFWWNTWNQRRPQFIFPDVGFPDHYGVDAILVDVHYYHNDDGRMHQYYLLVTKW